MTKRKRHGWVLVVSAVRYDRLSQIRDDWATDLATRRWTESARGWCVANAKLALDERGRRNGQPIRRCPWKMRWYVGEVL